MKIGRNDPCPCGSGKKYKKCCLQKDEAKRAEEQIVNMLEHKTKPIPLDEPPAEIQVPESPPDPMVEKWNTLFDEFKCQDYEGRIELFLSSMDEPGLLDGDGAFDMIDDIYQEAVKKGDYAQFNDLVDTLRSKLPDVYADSEVYYLDWYISNTLVLDQPDVLATKVRELAQADDNIDVFYWMLDRLEYHGYLQLLIEAMRIYKSGDHTSEDLMPFVMDDLAERAIDFEIFDYLEHHSEPDPNDPDLRDRLAYFIKDIRMDLLTEAVNYLTGHAGRLWSQNDFANLKSETSKRDLYYLSCEFLGELWREKHISFTRGELGRGELACYLLKRGDGKLEPKQGMLDAVMGQGKRHKPKYRPKQSPPLHILCPDRETFDSYLADLLNFMNPQIYKVMAFFEIVPYWLEFLESRSLIDEEIHKQTLNDLRPLCKTMGEIVNKRFPDPAQRPTIKEF